MKVLTKEEIEKNIIKSNGLYNHAILKNLIIPKDYLWCKSKIEYIEAILFDLKSPPICPICNKSIKYNNKVKTYPKYSDFCSDFCKTKNELKNIILTKEFIENYFIREDGNYNVHKIKVIDIPNEYNWCKTKVEYLDCIRYGIKEVPKCKNCNKPTKYLNSSKKEIKYQDFCSISCVNKYNKTKDKIKETNLKKYGKQYFTQTKEYLEKTKINNLKKYGYSSTNQKNINNIEEYNDLNYHSLQKWINKDGLFLIFEFMKYFNVTRKAVNDLKSKFNIKNYNTHNKSKTQKYIFKLLKRIDNNILYNKYNIIETKNKKLELDIFVPNFNFAIEYNGLTYHSYGISSLFKVLNNHQKEKELFSFRDDNVLNKNFYFKLKQLKYDFFELESREKYQKYKLEKYFNDGKLSFFDKNSTGELNMFQNDYRKIWDSGNLVFIKKY